MAKSASPIIALAAVVGGGFFLYAKGESDRANGQTTGLASFSASIDQLLGKTGGTVAAAASNVNRSGTPAVSSGGTPASSGGSSGGSQSGIGGAGVYQGTTVTILAAAQAAGMGATNEANGTADPYGAALWSLQSGNPQSAFAQQPTSVRATFDAVAIGLK